ncbi:hypothetical protein TNCV_184401 [Trichonephila clavipes]|nr:hypothetical protein TNCV_184401 [Trichonephila clavipes]
MIPAYNKKRCAAFLSRRESISGERLTSNPKKIQPRLTRDSNPDPLGFKPRVIAKLTGTRHCVPERVVHKRWCSITFYDVGALPASCYISGKWIGYRGLTAGPSRSPDPKVLEIFFWSHLKSLVYESPLPRVDNIFR